MLRVGAVSYLNSRPLIHGLRERLRGIADLSLNLPSRLADDLSSGRLDVALVPSIEFFRGIPRGYRVVSDAAIACRGPVWSVRLLSRVPISQIKRLALDEGSRTSATMVRILLSELHGIHPVAVTLTMEQDPTSADVDAVLLIGDRAMHPQLDLYDEIWDLGEKWCQWTGLPFVFAMWVARENLASRLPVETASLINALQQSRDAGTASFAEIARKEAGPHGLTIDDLSRYFEENLYFELGPRELDGLELFRQKASRLGLLDPLPAVTKPTSALATPRSFPTP